MYKIVHICIFLCACVVRMWYTSTPRRNNKWEQYDIKHKAKKQDQQIQSIILKNYVVPPAHAQRVFLRPQLTRIHWAVLLEKKNANQDHYRESTQIFKPHLHPPILLAAVRTLLPPASPPSVVIFVWLTRDGASWGWTRSKWHCHTLHAHVGVLIGFVSAGITHVVSHFLLKNRHRLRHCHHRHCHLRCRSLHPCALTEKEAAVRPPPVYQRQHHREHVYKSWQLGLI